ncbi:aminopeptidase [Crenobacter caeni]|uniref:Aminopeptidase n=1 Tax=Crenobacter caeni TaxID=2705474 RepID=A0A6B2KQE5_9NEIS|nr:aminopeptidase [Crenobacter caeni]NDV12354.1 aminopeptidase [Crenobacter caeni]
MPRNLFKLSAFAIALGFAAVAQAAPHGEVAAREMVHVATAFKGRMAGTAQEKAVADYLAGKFRAMGYQVVEQPFTSSFEYEKADKQKEKREVKSLNVIATKPGQDDKVVIVGAHFDSRTPKKDGDIGKIGGPGLEGLDDNASGVGMLLELADQLKSVKTKHTIKFVGFGAEELGLLGAKDYVARMTDTERSQLIAMVNMDSLITGDKMYFHAGKNTVAKDAKAGHARDRALAIAKKLGVAAGTNPGLNKEYPKGTGCCSDQEAFDEAGVPVLAVEATNWEIGDKDGYEQTTNKAIKDGMSWHRPDVDNVANLKRVFPNRVEERARDFSRVLTPLVIELAGGKVK